MYEDVLPILPLNKAVAFGCVKPLHCALFSHVLPSLTSDPAGYKKGGTRGHPTRVTPLMHRTDDSKSQIRIHYNRRLRSKAKQPVAPAILGPVNLAFFRLRLHFRAVEPVRFPAGKAGNILRGVFGMSLRRIACVP